MIVFSNKDKKKKLHKEQDQSIM